MAMSDNSKWIMFIGGVILGSAVAAGVAYAATSHYLSIYGTAQFAHEQEALRLRRKSRAGM
jgi:archaellum component FlaG (FlaF/FlaG flagellin family)